MTTPSDTQPEKVKRKKSPPYKGGAPFGNQNALGHGCGRPPKYDLDKEADELLEWSKKPDSTAIYQFTDNKDYLADELDEFADRNVNFALALKKAKERIGQRREEHCNMGTMNYGVWNRSAAIYHSGLHKFEKAQKEFEANLRIKQEEKSFEEIAKGIAEGVCRAQKS